MSLIHDEYIEGIVKEVAAGLNLRDWKFKKQNIGDIAQNYFGVIIPINLRGKCKNNTLDISLILKVAPNDDRFRVSGAVTLMFAREIFVYSNVFTEFRKMQEVYSLSPFVLPKLFYVRRDYCKEVLVLENMCEEGYTPYLKSSFLDFDHITAGLKALAQFHALSIILQQKNPHLYKQIEEVCVPLNEKTNKRFMDILTNRLEKAQTSLSGTSYEPLLLNLKTNCAKYVELANTDVKMLCLCHGDIWKENLLFKYEEDKPTSACIIDLQTARICSPAYDILFLIVSSTGANLRKEYFHKLLDIYYETFISLLCEAKINTDEYSKENLDYDLSVVGPACFIIANTALWLSNGLQEEGHVRSKKRFNTEDDKLHALNQYKDIIKNLLDDLNSYGYLTII